MRGLTDTPPVVQAVYANYKTFIPVGLYYEMPEM